MNTPSFSVIGTGSLGSVLARALHHQGFIVKSLYNRSQSTAATLGDELNASIVGNFPKAAVELGEIVFLTVPDRAIRDCADRLSNMGKDFSKFVIAHCSGNYSSELLSELHEKGAATASFHPLQTFTTSSVYEDFKNIYIDIEGDTAAVKALEKVAVQLGSNTLEVEAAAKPYLHAAAVMASNYMVALMEAAGQTAELGGISKKEALQALLPLAQKNMANITSSSSLQEALSGPIARGDASTVQTQLEMLQGNPDLHHLYRQLGKVLLELKQKSAEKEQDGLRELERLLATGDEKRGTK